MMTDGLIVIGFCIFVFALLGVQLFQGSLHQICVQRVEWPELFNFSDPDLVDLYYSEWINNNSKKKLNFFKTNSSFYPKFYS